MNLLRQRLAAALASLCLLAGCGAATQTAPTSVPTAAPTSDPAIVSGLCPNAPAPLDQPIVAGFGGNIDLWTVQADGIAAAQLTSAPPGAAISSAAWSPDGKTLAYTMVAPNPDPAAVWRVLGVICAFDRATGQGRLLIASSPGSQPSEISWMPDGAALLATYRYAIKNDKNEFVGQEVAVGLYDLATAQETSIITSASSPAVSPDGTRLAYTYLDLSVGFPALMLAGIDGSNPRVLADPDPAFTSITNLRWSPDGAQLVFSARGGPTGGEGSAPAERSWLARLFGAGVAAAHGETASLWIVRADGSDLRPLLPTTDDPLATWSPDGKTLLVSDWSEGLFTLDPATGEQTFLGVESREFWSLEWASH
jgi:Tol biopolymer transport system component